MSWEGLSVELFTDATDEVERLHLGFGTIAIDISGFIEAMETLAREGRGRERRTGTASP